MPSTPRVTMAFSLRDAVPKIMNPVSELRGTPSGCRNPPFPWARKRGPSPAAGVRIRRVLQAARSGADKTPARVRAASKGSHFSRFPIAWAFRPHHLPGLIRSPRRIPTAQGRPRARAAPTPLCAHLPAGPLASSASRCTTDGRAAALGPRPSAPRPALRQGRRSLGGGRPGRRRPSDDAAHG